MSKIVSMSTTPAGVNEVIDRLWKTGHFFNPAFPDANGVTEADLPNLELDSPEVRQAAASYQLFLSEEFNNYSLAEHGREGYPDGEIGPATTELILAPRCMVPDYDPVGYKPERLGSGNWKNCWGSEGKHHCKVLYTGGMPSHVSAVFEQVWKGVVESYAEVGLYLELVKSGEYNTHMQFVGSSSGWIGLATVVNNASCSSKIFNRYLSTYRPSNTANEWMTLFKHELGHNCGMSHSSGGVMNPSIRNGLPKSWKGDPSWNLLVSRFGGEPIQIPGGSPPDGPDPPDVPNPPTGPRLSFSNVVIDVPANIPAGRYNYRITPKIEL
jgi:hypothetical protein